MSRNIKPNGCPPAYATLKSIVQATKIFVNLPVKGLEKSMEFFTKLGFRFNPQFTDETATCMIVSEDIFVMLLTEAKFKTFTLKEICDTTESTEMLVCVSLQSREKGDEMVREANPNTTGSCIDTGFRSETGTFGN